jgi:hypothetical protein
MSDPENDQPTTTTPSEADSLDSKLDASLSAAYDKIEGKADRQAHREAPLSPSTPVEATADKSFDASFSKTFDYLQLSKGEQDKQAAERQSIDDIKAFAKSHNLSFAEAQAYKGQQPQSGQLSPELSAAAESVRQLYGDKPFHEITKGYADLDAYLRKDPIDGLRHIGEQLGMNRLQLAQQLAVRFGDQQLVMHNATNLVDNWFASNQAAEPLQDIMLELIQSGKVQRSGSITNDLQTAFDLAQRQQKSERKERKQHKHLDRSLRSAYDRAQARSK